MRVAGHVPTEVHAYGIGHREQQVTVRIGDALLYITDARTAAPHPAQLGRPPARDTPPARACIADLAARPAWDLPHRRRPAAGC